MIRLLIVDDDALVRTGLELILGGEPDIAIVGHAANGVEAEALARDTSPDIVLLDIRMPVQDGVVTAQHLRARPVPPTIIMLTTFDADDLVLRALRAGATGFLLKDTAPDKLIAAIRAVAAGDPVMSPTVTRQLVAAATKETDSLALRDRALGELAQLTDRELEIATDIAHGLSNTEIGAKLFISVATVKATVTRIFQKLGTDNRVRVAMKVKDAGID